MRKYFIEKYSFYKLLEELNTLPLGSPSIPYYYKKRYDFIDVYVVFMQYIPDPSDKLMSVLSDDDQKTAISLFFYRKPKDVRRSSQVVPICQISVGISEFISLVLLPQVTTISDLINKLSLKYKEINTALDNACMFDTQT